MVQAFDHRAASVVVNPQNLNRPGQPREATPEEHSNPHWLPDPQFWVSEDSYEWPWPLQWVLGFKEITAPTNRRTVIASLFPRAAFGNKSPIFLPAIGDPEETAAAYKDCAVLLAANLNSIALDFVARQKVHGQTLNLYLLEQFPLIPSDAYLRRFGDRTAADLIRDHVLRLTYTSHDMAPFARDLGHHGPPFPWDDRSPPPPPRPPRRPLLPPLRPRPRRRRLHPLHLPHHQTPRPSPIRPLPHQSSYPCLHERAGRWRH